MKRLSEPKVLEQIVKLRGNVAAVARAFGVARSSVIQFVKNRPELKQALADARESLVDDAESALAVAVTAKEGWAVCFTLKCLGKDRGYIERVEHAHSGTLTHHVHSDLSDAELEARIAELEKRAGGVSRPAGGAGGPASA